MQYVIGKFYKVTAVHVREWRDWHSRWIPIVGPKHTDNGVVNFPWEHWHIDWCFIAKDLFDSIYSWAGEKVYGAPIQCPDTQGTVVVDRGPELRRMTYKRTPPSYPYESAKWLPELSRQMAGCKITNGKCPHRGVPVEAMIQTGDVLTCPAHGLRFNRFTGELIQPSQRSSWAYRRIMDRGSK